MSCRSRLLITEDDRKHILGLYGLINEAVTEGQGIITIEADSTFPAGYYSESYLTQQGKEEIKTGLSSAKNWLTENKDSLISVQIMAGESRITNYDNEQSPKKFLEPYKLSELRAKTLKRVLKPYFEELVSSGVLSKMPIFEPPKIEIGVTPYTQGQTITDSQRSKYNKEQYVKVVLKLINPGECAVGLGVTVSYDKTENSAFKCRGGHKCDIAKFDVLVNGVSIGIANLNNAKDGGSRTSGLLTVKPEMAEAIAAFDKEKLTISLKCLSGNDCHSSTPEVKIQKEGTAGQPPVILYHSCSPAMERGDQNEYKLLTLDACGNVIEKGTGDVTNNEASAADETSTETTANTAGTTTTETPGYDLYLFNADTWDKGTNVTDISKFFIGVSPLGTNGTFMVSKGWTSTGFTGELIVPDRGIVFDPKKIKGGTDFSGTKGQIYSEKYGYALNLDPGTKITNIYKDKTLATNLPPGFAENPFITCNQSTGSGKWHIECEVNNDQFKFPFFVEGPSESLKKVLDKKAAEDAQKLKDAETERINRDKTSGVVEFKMDDIDTIQDFETYYSGYIKKRDDLNKGYGKDYYEVTAVDSKGAAGYITYGGKKYPKGKILHLTV